MAVSDLPVKRILPLFYLLLSSFVLAQDQNISRSVILIIDAGHGGSDSGAKNPEAGLTEKDLALGVAQRLEKSLRQEKKLTVILTRTGDIDLPLYARAEKANKAKGHLLLSLHTAYDLRADSAGPRVYFCSLENFTARLSAQVGSFSKSLPELTPWDESQIPFINESNDLALLLQNRLNPIFLSDRSIQTSPLLLLQFSAMPAVLVELGNLSDPADVWRLKGAEALEQMNQALKSSVLEFLSSLTR